MSDNLIDVKEAQKRLGFDRPQQVHQLLKKCPNSRVKDGRRTFIDWSVLQVWTEENPEHGVGQGPVRRTKTTELKSPEQVEKEARENLARGYPRPFEPVPEFVLWNKGLWRGWSFGAVETCDETAVTFITQSAKKHLWVPLTVAASVAEGTMFVLDPGESVRFIALQLTRVRKDDDRFKEVIKRLSDAADLLDEIKEDREDE